MNSKLQGITIPLSAAVLGFALIGCEEPETPQPQPPVPTAQTPPAATPANPSGATAPVTQGGGSALGSAKRSAENVVSQAEQQQHDLLREMGEAPAPPPDDDE